MKTFHLTVARVGESIFDGEAVSVSLPGSQGRVQVLANHAPFVFELNSGDGAITTPDGDTQIFSITRGMVEVSHNNATVLL